MHFCITFASVYCVHFTSLHFVLLLFLIQWFYKLNAERNDGFFSLHLSIAISLFIFCLTTLSFSIFLHLLSERRKKNPKKWKSRKRKESTWKLACKGIWDHLMCSCLAKIIKMWFYLWNSTLCSIGLAFASCIVHFKHSWSQYITMIAFGSAWVRYVCRYSFRSVGNSHWMIFSFFLLRKLFCSKRNFKFKISTNRCKRANGLTIWKQWSRSWALLLRINAKCAQWNRISTNPNMISVAFLSFNCARFDGFMCFMPYDRRFTLC